MVPTKGQLWMDEGAVRAVKQRAKSLFSAGIVRAVGVFNAQDAVQLCDEAGVPFAQGLCNYASEDVNKTQGVPQNPVIAILTNASAASQYILCLSYLLQAKCNINGLILQVQANSSQIIQGKEAHFKVACLQGKHSQDIRGVLGFAGSEEIVHRDNISMLALRNPPSDALTAAPPYAVMDEAPQSAPAFYDEGPSSRYLAS